jgi:DNA-binding CsgD family transcriptional regulator
MLVLMGLADGLTLRQVASRLHLGHQTVRTQATALRRRLGASTTPHAVALAYQRGLLHTKTPTMTSNAA